MYVHTRVYDLQPVITLTTIWLTCSRSSVYRSDQVSVTAAAAASADVEARLHGADTADAV